ncbi:MAG: hypothetical protein CO118_10695 [Flavobacteriales bacterium CG_4_9_14_3_um_filter_32_8]|nr:MAG: hypothetical protein CO118_10695 [Flavobacteriales bacterium CG_4_9_14_3_um_filter_32_8]
MKNFGLVILLFVLTTCSYAQEMRTIIRKDSTKTFTLGGYGEPFAGATQLNKDWGIMIGIKGGMVINRHFAFGPVAKVYAGLWEFQGNNLNYNDSANLELYMGSIGFFMEYSIKMESPIHISIPVNIMIGGVQINEDMGAGDVTFDEMENNVYNIESSGLVIIEPGVNIDFNVAKFFIPNIKVGYRLAMGTQLVNVSNQDLSGIYFGLGLKFGKF